MKVPALTLLCLLHCSTADVNTNKFPANFSFGVATAAYQIEGGWNADNKGPSIWDTLTHQVPSVIANGDTGDVAADFYHHYETDVQLLKDLGVTHYRFSIAWSRILPTGFADNVNDLGIQFYRNLIKLLKKNDIIPLVTLYHWDLPQGLQDHGGFLNDSFKDWFADYARICFDSFGDDVMYWSTFNEPLYACIGYLYPNKAPGITSSSDGQYVCGHNLLRAHAAAWHVYYEEFKEKQDGLVSLATVTTWSIPATDQEEDIEAAETMRQFYLGYFSNPCFFGDYPQVIKDRVALRSKLEGFNQSRLPEFTEEEKASLKGTCDYYGLNNYNSTKASAIPEPEIGDPSFFLDIGVGTSDVAPTGRAEAFEMLKYVQEQYNDPYIIIMENGLAIPNKTHEDDSRIEVIQNFLSGISDAIDENVKVVGYTAWSLLDSFEWDHGYTYKFGLYDVDFDSENRTRTPRKSANWYQGVIQSRCLTDECVE